MTADQAIPSRTNPLTRAGRFNVTNDTAMRHSAVWAACRLRADLMSTFPVDVYRTIDGLQYEMPKPPILAAPGGEKWDFIDWMYATQQDLDRAGNTVGLITERSGVLLNGVGLPARIDLQQIADVAYVQRRDRPDQWRIGGKLYDLADVWHERQYVVAGLPVGLSPIAYAALSIGEYMSAQQFALDWFSSGGVPKARMKNKAKVLKADDVRVAKGWWRDTINNGDLLVHGSDWEYDMIQSQVAGMEWLEGRRYGLTDVARFFNVPSDLLDAAVSGSSVTYANITQRNLQFLITALAPAVIRREKNLTKLLPAPRFVKLNTDALLRMDPETRAKLLKTRIDSRTLTVTEARALDNLPPLTQADIDEFDTLFPPKAAVSTTEKVG